MMLRCVLFNLIFGVTSYYQQSLLAGIHTAPIIIPAYTLDMIQYHPLKTYRLFRTSQDGMAKPIPFQIDEKDQYGDFILPYGFYPNKSAGNNIFDYLDEISFMGNDVGPVKRPTKWSDGKIPNNLYEIRFKYKKKHGAVYVGIYYDNPPHLSPSSYILFDYKKQVIKTSRYNYYFDHRNYLVVRGVDLSPQYVASKNKKKSKYTKLLYSSTFYMHVNLKYFLTLNLNQENITSSLKSYTIGPIRTIARVDFSYSLLTMKFNLGMYTEVSFYSNSVILPAVVDNPLNGHKSLNKDSLFYYGFAIAKNPKHLKIKSNMPRYKKKSWLSGLQSNNKVVNNYWISAHDPNYMLYINFQPSKQMLKSKNIPMMYIENIAGQAVSKRSSSSQPLGKSQVNIAVALDLATLTKGVHNVKFQLFIDNEYSPVILEQYKTLNNWLTFVSYIDVSKYKKL